MCSTHGTCCTHVFLSALYKALGEDLRGVCTDYHAEPGLGLRCSVELSTLLDVVDESVLRQCVNIPGSRYNSPLVNTAHKCQVYMYMHITFCAHVHVTI